MLPSPVPADPGWDEDLAWLDRDPEREDWLARAREHDEPPGEDEDDGDFEPFTPEELAEIDEAAADELLAVKAATTGRRGPGQPGSARVFPGESCQPRGRVRPGDAAGRAAGLRAAWRSPPSAAAEDGFAGVSEAELVGVMCGWDRVEAHAHARKLAAVAELARRNPGELDQEFTARPGRVRAGGVPGPGRQPDRHGPDPARPACPAPRRGWRTGRSPGIRRRSSPGPPCCWRTRRPARPRQEVLDRAARLTPAGLRAAIARAVIKAAPKKAKERRETAARNARVERWLQDTGNAALMGCELPPAEALAADEQITARAKELRKAGLEGDMDQLRARAYLDLLLGTDSRPGQGGAAAAAAGPAGAAAAGFAGRVTLTVAAGHPGRPGGPAR